MRIGRKVQEVSRSLRRTGATGALTRLIITGVIAGAATTGYATFRIWQEGMRDDRRPADVIVVMGAAQYDGTPSPVFAARIDHARPR